MRLHIAKLEMSKNIRTRDGARHFVTKITLPKASDVTPLPPEKKTLRFKAIWKNDQKIIGGGAIAPSRPPGAAPLKLT